MKSQPLCFSHQNGALEKNNLSLNEKIKLLDFAKRDGKLGCRKLAEILKIEKTAAAIILKNEKKIREQYELFHEKFRKRNRPGKYQLINDILYEWYQKCCA